MMDSSTRQDGICGSRLFSFLPILQCIKPLQVPFLFSSSWFGAVIGISSFIALQWGKMGIITIILVSGGIGFARFLHATMNPKNCFEREGI
jgi:hypothetical protein